MAEAKASDEHKELNCPICLETFESPKVLTCLHTFCEKCICKHVRSMREEGIQFDSISCPICRSPNLPPVTDQTLDDWAAKLPINYMVLSSLTLNQSGKDDIIHCQPCLTDGKRNIASAFCVNCSEYLCKICHDCHKKFKMSNSHTTTLLSIPENQLLSETKDRLFRCARHTKKYTYFCQEDKDLCCSKCAITGHRLCKDLILIEDLSSNVAESLETKKVLENVCTLRQMFLRLLENRLNNLKSIKQNKTEISQAIKDWTKEVKDLTDKLETVTLEELEQAYKQEEVIISDQIVECKSAIAAIETSERILLQEKKSNDGTKLFMSTTRISQQVLKYLKMYDAVDEECRDITLEFQRDKNFEGVVKTLSSLGHMLSKTSKLPGLFPDISHERAMVLSPRAQKDSMQIWNAKLEDDVVTCEMYSGIFLSDDRIVLCDNGNKKLKLFDQLYHFVSYLKMTEEPRFICSVDTETLAVTTSGSRIEIVSVAITLTNLRSISVHGECYGLAFYHTNVIVDIYDGKQDAFLTYNKSNQVIKRIRVPDHVSSPSDALCLSPDVHSIYYTVEDRLVTLDMDGKELSRFESNDLEGACGITVDKNGIVYCCGKKSQTVIQVTPAGRQLRVLLSSDDGLKNPIGICLNKKNNVILVTEEKSNEVKMFKLI